MAFKRKAQVKSDHFVASDDDDGTTRPAKKGKSTGSDFKPSTQVQTDSEGAKYWEISKMRRVTVSDYNGKSMVSIREYYEKDGRMLPGKKGISMTMEQYAAFINVMPQVEELLTGKGESVPRPDYDGEKETDMINEPAIDEEEEARKANIEATSDEEE